MSGMNNLDGGGGPGSDDRRPQAELIPESWGFQALTMLQTGTARPEHDPGIGGGPTATASLGFPLPHQEPDTYDVNVPQQPAPSAMPRLGR